MSTSRCRSGAGSSGRAGPASPRSPLAMVVVQAGLVALPIPFANTALGLAILLLALAPALAELGAGGREMVIVRAG